MRETYLPSTSIHAGTKCMSNMYIPHTYTHIYTSHTHRINKHTNFKRMKDKAQP